MEGNLPGCFAVGWKDEIKEKAMRLEYGVAAQGSLSHRKATRRWWQWWVIKISYIFGLLSKLYEGDPCGSM